MHLHDTTVKSIKYIREVSLLPPPYKSLSAISPKWKISVVPSEFLF